MNKDYQIGKPEEFVKIFADIFSSYTKPESNSLVIALRGDLGAGKTAFTKELAKYLGVSEVVNSPTFIIMKQYELTHESFDLLVHIDAYRIDDESEVSPLRLQEVLERPKTITCIEWPELIPSAIPDNVVQISIKIAEGKTREVSVTTPD